MTTGRISTLVLIATFATLRTGTAEATCGHGEECPARSGAKDNVLIQLKGALKMQGALKTKDTVGEGEGCLNDSECSAGTECQRPAGYCAVPHGKSDGTTCIEDSQCAEGKECNRPAGTCGVVEDDCSDTPPAHLETHNGKGMEDGISEWCQSLQRGDWNGKDVCEGPQNGAPNWYDEGGVMHYCRKTCGQCGGEGEGEASAMQVGWTRGRGREMSNAGGLDTRAKARARARVKARAKARARAKASAQKVQGALKTKDTVGCLNDSECSAGTECQRPAGYCAVPHGKSDGTTCIEDSQCAQGKACNRPAGTCGVVEDDCSDTPPAHLETHNGKGMEDGISEWCQSLQRGDWNGKDVCAGPQNGAPNWYDEGGVMHYCRKTCGQCGEDPAIWATCEGQGFNEAECGAIEVCEWDDGQCWWVG